MQSHNNLVQAYKANSSATFVELLNGVQARKQRVRLSASRRDDTFVEFPCDARVQTFLVIGAEIGLADVGLVDVRAAFAAIAQGRPGRTSKGQRQGYDHQDAKTDHRNADGIVGGHLKHDELRNREPFWSPTPTRWAPTFP
jgi:hypothetical protein